MSDIEAAIAALVKDAERIDKEIHRINANIVGLFIMVTLSLFLAIATFIWR